jgi:cytochrome c5
MAFCGDQTEFSSGVIRALSDQDQKIFDLIVLVIGVLIGIVVGIFVIARDLGNETQARMNLNDPDYQAAVVARIEPFGKVTLDGETIEVDPEVERVTQAEAAPELMTGPQVYNAACLACHGGGIGGAPTTGDAAAWGPRIAQGADTLNQHALEGFQGSAGYMPPKGGRTDLSDEEIVGAVQYLVDQAR